MKPKILLVDDVEMFVELEKNILDSPNVTLLSATNGFEALKIVQRERPDLIVMDLNMPVMDGAACCRKLKSSPLYRDIPVIMVTFAPNEETIRACRDAGCDELLAKPLNVGLFLEKVHDRIPAVERRKTRVPMQVPVVVRTREGVISGISYDLSLTGLFVETDAGISEGSEVIVTFTLPTSDLLFTIRGVVARVILAPGATLPSGAGIRFNEIIGEDTPANMRKLLKKYLDGIIRDGGEKIVEPASLQKDSPAPTGHAAPGHREEAPLEPTTEDIFPEEYEETLPPSPRHDHPAGNDGSPLPEPPRPVESVEEAHPAMVSGNGFLEEAERESPLERKELHLMLFGMLLLSGIPGADLHAAAARKGGATWEELRSVVRIASAVHGLPTLLSGNEILQGMENRERS